MSILFLELHHFRNHTQTAFSAEPSGFNIFWGANGSGKTSLLEAIYYLGNGRSFRAQKKDLLIQEAEDKTVLRAHIQDGNRFSDLGVMRYRNGDVKWQVDESSVVSPHQLFRLFPTKLLNTHSYDLLEGEPKFRRNLLNWGVFHVEPEFFDEWKRYTRALKQRNHLLSTGGSASALHAWSHLLADSGEKIATWHQGYLDALIPEIQANLALYELPEVEWKYACGWDSRQSLLVALESSIHRDQQVGFTKFGIHRADLLIRRKGAPVHQTFSRGQQKRLLYAIMLAQGRLLNLKSSVSVTYLLDDLMAELDRDAGKLMMLQLAESGNQVFLTAVEQDHLKGFEFGESPRKMFHVEHGQVRAIE